MLPAGYPTLLAECDPSGGDVAAWAQLPTSPGWSTAVSASDRSWAAIADNTQQLPSGLRLMAAPARAAQAHTAVGEAAREFAGLLAAAPDVVTVADCGPRRVRCAARGRRRRSSRCCSSASRSCSAPATVPRVDRAIEALGVLRSACRQVGVVLIGGAPYRSAEIAAALGIELFGVLPEDASGAALVAGGWTVGKRAVAKPARQGRHDARRAGHRSDLRASTTAPNCCGARRRSDDARPAAPTDRPDARRAARRPAAPARARPRRHRRQARRPQGPGVAQRRLADVGRRREGRLGHRDPPRARRLQRGTRPRRPASAVGAHPPGGARGGDGARLRTRRARRPVGQRGRREYRRQRARARSSSPSSAASGCAGRRSPPTRTS